MQTFAVTGACGGCGRLFVSEQWDSQGFRGHLRSWEAEV
jgi:hypothetical protein